MNEQFKAFKIEIFKQKNDVKKYKFKYGKLDSVHVSESVGTGVRVFSEGKWGQYYASKATMPLDEIIKKAIDSLKYSKGEGYFPEIEPLVSTEEEMPLEDLTKQEAERMIERMQEALSASAKGGVTFPEASFSVSTAERSIETSLGVNLVDKTRHYTAVVYGKASDSDKKEETGYDYLISRHYKDFDFEKMAKKAASNALFMLGAKKDDMTDAVVELDYPIVIDFLELLLFSFSGENIIKKQSCLIHESNKKFSPLLTLIDDGISKEGLSTTLFDGEGTKRQKTVLIQAGDVKDILTSYEVAKQLKVKNSGNAARKNLVQIGVAATNIEMQASNLTKEAYGALHTKRVLIKEVMGLHMVNPITGEFSLGAKGAFINGDTVQAVKGFVISGNLIDVFKTIEAISPSQKRYGNYLVPKIISTVIKIVR